MDNNTNNYGSAPGAPEQYSAPAPAPAYNPAADNAAAPAAPVQQQPAPAPQARPVYLAKLPVSAPVPIERPHRGPLQMPAIVQPIALMPTISLEDPLEQQNPDYYQPVYDGYGPGAMAAPYGKAPAYGQGHSVEAPMAAYLDEDHISDNQKTAKLSKGRCRGAGLIMLIMCLLFLVPFILGIAMPSMAPFSIGDNDLSIAFNATEAESLTALAEGEEEGGDTTGTEEEGDTTGEEEKKDEKKETNPYNVIGVIMDVINKDAEIMDVVKSETIFVLAAVLFVIINFIVALVGLIGGGGKKGKRLHYWVCALITFILVAVVIVFNIVGLDAFGIEKLSIEQAFLGDSMQRLVMAVLAFLGLIGSIIAAAITGKKHKSVPEPEEY